MIGKAFGHYQVLEKLGEGGMGRVFRARDTKLNRDVALKVISEAFATDRVRMARFEREALLLASLNHPSIASIYGVEESEGIRALVMELAEGRTLADRIAEGAIPLDEALPLATQIAEGLEFAHGAGVIHRDLKPANIKVTPLGNVKLLDFGLAKALEGESALIQQQSVSGMSGVPALSALETQAGAFLGTPGYTSPEQARGAAVDKRADIWAFGVILWEMLTGRRLFAGETLPDTLAAVLRAEVDWGALPADVPPSLRRLLRRCLERDRKRRLPDIGVARLEIGDAVSLPADEQDSVASGTSAALSVWRRTLPWVVAVLASGALILTVVLWRVTRPAEQPFARLSVDMGAGATLDSLFGSSIIISPDGKEIVFSGHGTDGKQRLYLRFLDQNQVIPLPGTENAHSPFFSADGKWVGFFTESRLKKVSVLGSAATTLCEAPTGRGGSWGRDGQIIAALTNRSGLSRVPAAGGAPVPVSELNRQRREFTHRWPQILPGGQTVLFTANTSGTNFDEANIDVLSMKTGERRTLLHGGFYGRYLPSGHLIYVREGRLFAAGFDPESLMLTSSPVPILDDVASRPGIGAAEFASSDDGTFLYVPGGQLGRRWSAVWLNGSGTVRPVRLAPGNYRDLRLSPDGSRLALTVFGNNKEDLWVYDLHRETFSRLTAAPGPNQVAVWAPDGRHIALRSERHGGVANIYWMLADGSDVAYRLSQSDNYQQPCGFSSDGKRLVYVDQNSETDWDLWTLPLDLSDPDRPSPGAPELFLRTPYREGFAAFSPDGKWIAYVSNESGADEVYVRPFPPAEGKTQISSRGGGHPVWSRRGQELFYRDSDGWVMAVGYTIRDGNFRAQKPRRWIEHQAPIASLRPGFDLSPGADQVVMLQVPEGEPEYRSPTHATFLLHLFNELRRHVSPAGQ